MRLRNIFFFPVIAALTCSLASCEGEKDLIIITDDLPIKASALYMVGNSTPTGWDIDNPTPMVQSESDPLIFEWEGRLQKGELKLCVQTGSWDVAFIRPVEDKQPISDTDLTDEKFTMSAGNPDRKWNVTIAGTYHLTFNLREWTMSTICLQADEPGDDPSNPGDTTPIEADNVYMVGDATPAGWNIDAPFELERISDYVFEYSGPLNRGEMKACISTGSWDVEFIRPLENGQTITTAGLDTSFQYHAGDPDEKWVVTDAGDYRLTFDLSARTFKAEYLGETAVDKTPIESQTLYMIGDATPNGWSMDNATEFTQTEPYIFSWEGTLIEGTLKLCLEPDGTFSCPFIRPLSPDVEIGRAGVASPDFVYTTAPDDQWRVTESGRYRLTFNLRDWTIEALWLGQ